MMLLGPQTHIHRGRVRALLQKTPTVVARILFPQLCRFAATGLTALRGGLGVGAVGAVGGEKVTL